ncbi:MAG: ABC transporter ATP-binding protein [Bacteroidetes bacterium]|nr:ABC transporter ATP-binding protein [Bacteroidota bacterium]
MQAVSIEVKNVVKRYKHIVALADLSFTVSKGEIFGFIGPDGAGKTTLFRILTTVLLADSGEALVEGLDVVRDYKKIRKLVGYMPGRFSLYMDLTVEENLTFYATIFGSDIKQNYHLIKDIYSQIERFKDRRAGQLSGGMKQKLALSCALIHKPSVLFLDEPTTGVDAVSRMEFWEMLRRLRESGITIVVSTPYMDEAGLCDRIALIQNGHIMKIDKPEGIISNYPHRLYSVKTDDIYRLLTDLKEYPGAGSVQAFGQSAHLAFTEDLPDRSHLSAYLEQRGHRHIGIEKTEPNIEDCFIDLMVTPGVDG